MSLAINNNSLSLHAQRSLGKHVAAQETLINRLTAGTRIVKAADDPAGQAVAARIDAGLRGVSQAMRSISDGSSMLQVADGALANVADSLQRLRELAVASGNGSSAAATAPSCSRKRWTSCITSTRSAPRPSSTAKRCFRRTGAASAATKGSAR